MHWSKKVLVTLLGLSAPPAVIRRPLYWIGGPIFNSAPGESFPTCPLIRPLTGGQLFATLMDINEHGRLFYRYKLLAIVQSAMLIYVHESGVLPSDVGLGGGGSGGASAPQKFWCVKNLGKILENPGTIGRNLGKICENLCKIPDVRAKMAPNVVWFEKMAPNVGRITWRPILEVIPKTFFMRKYLYKKWPKFFRQVWGNWGKNPSHPKKFSCSYTCVFSTSWSLPWHCLFRSVFLLTIMLHFEELFRCTGYFVSSHEECWGARRQHVNCILAVLVIFYNFTFLLHQGSPNVFVQGPHKLLQNISRAGRLT